MNGPKQTDFGPVGLAAALHSSPDQIRELVRAGVIRADHVRDKEPRWGVKAFADVIKQLLPVPPGKDDSQRLSGLRTLIGLEALLRAEKAEGQEVAND